MINETQKQLFQEEVWDYYRNRGRHDLPWRQPDLNGTFDPYKIVVSELMLQQTQVARVIPKFLAFLKQFPAVADLAQSDIGAVLRAWSGLGYNRRAKFLHQTAQAVIADYNGVFPNEITELIKLPGIGRNTAGAIVAYAYTQPALFIETNIRTVYIQHFFQGQTGIDDKQIIDLLAQTIDIEQPREWYWALMDYGSHLKSTVGNLNLHSKHFTKQSAFRGSRRQIRGQVIRLLGEKPQTNTQLAQQIIDERLDMVLADLLQEDMIQKDGSTYKL